MEKSSEKSYISISIIIILIVVISVGIYFYINQSKEYETRMTECKKKSEEEKNSLEDDYKKKIDKNKRKIALSSPFKEFRGKISSYDRDINNDIDYKYLTFDENNNQLNMIDTESFFKSGGQDNDNLFFNYDSNNQLLKKSYTDKCVEYIDDNIQLSDCNNSLNQRWKLYEKKISPITDSNKCLKNNAKLEICDNKNHLRPVPSLNYNKEKGEELQSLLDNLYECDF